MPKPSETYLEILEVDTLCCARLLHAIFRPQKYYHHHDVRKAVEPPPDAPSARVEKGHGVKSPLGSC